MSLGMCFWIVMLILLIYGPAAFWPSGPAPGRAWVGPMGFSFIIWLLFFLVGWKSFGPPLHP